MKAIYVSPVTVIVQAETESDMINGTLDGSKDDTLHKSDTQTDIPGPSIGGDEEHSGDDDLDGAKRNWNCWDIE